jgi:hypothetical protein
MKTCMGAEVQLHSFSTLATRCRNVFRSTAMATLHQLKEPAVYNDRRLGELQKWSGHIGGERDLLSLP